MRKAIGVAVVMVGVLSAVASGAASLPEPVYVTGDLHAAQPDYLYRTAKVAEPRVEKRLWDYLSFFAIRPGPEPGDEFPAAEAEDLRARIRELARQLIANAPRGIGDEYVLTVNTFVNLNNLYSTSSLGRYLGEQMIGELQSAGVGVIDVRKSKGLMVREGFGEYGLSRDMAELSPIHGSQARVVGTYTYASGQLLLNARILRNQDGMVLSHANLAFELDGLTGQMLKDEAMPPRRGGVVKIEAVQ